jgi:membrane-associated phospholipid phosphatase
MTPLRRWLVSLFAVVLTATISYWWLDRPIARLAQSRLPHNETFARVSQVRDPFIPLAAVTLIALALWSISGRPLSKLQTTAAVCSLSVLMAEATKNQLKFVFGRTWPEAWFPDGPSFIRDGAYGFNPFHGGVGYGSFPSGHMAVACAVISVLWIFYPKLRAPYFLAALGVAGGLVGGNFHFLSDVIGGAFIGASTGWMATRLWQDRRAST